jgi:hypothetical protein
LLAVALFATLAQDLSNRTPAPEPYYGPNPPGRSELRCPPELFGSNAMAQAVAELTEQGSPAFEAALPILSQLLKAETADREVRSTASRALAGSLHGAD